MPDRADYLARVLVERLKGTEPNGAGSRDEREIDASRRNVVVKVMAVHAGITDEATIQRVTSALPLLRSDKTIAARDVAELAEFLRANLDLSLGA